MADINLTFTIKDGRFSLCATLKGTSKRNYKEVSNLINADFDSWDKKKQLFNAPTKEAIQNNSVLQELKTHYQYLIDTFNPQTPKDLFTFNHDASDTIEEKKELTLGDYLKELIHSMKNENSKMPSKNYQCYITLLHKLEVEKKIIKMPLKEIDDTHFIAFGAYILDKLKGVNYLGLMKRFRATLERARKAKLTKNILDYSYMLDAPKNLEKAAKKIRNGIDILTVKEYKRFVDMNLNTIKHGNKSQLKHMELYRDFCIFLYETKMRPCDVVKLKGSDIENDLITYWATKKKNYTKEKSAFVQTPLTKIAKDIMNKYAGKSTYGYIFPFAMNEFFLFVGTGKKGFELVFAQDKIRKQILFGHSDLLQDVFVVIRYAGLFGLFQANLHIVFVEVTLDLLRVLSREHPGDDQCLFGECIVERRFDRCALLRIIDDLVYVDLPERHTGQGY